GDHLAGLVVQNGAANRSGGSERIEQRLRLPATPDRGSDRVGDVLALRGPRGPYETAGGHGHKSGRGDNRRNHLSFHRLQHRTARALQMGLQESGLLEEIRAWSFLPAPSYSRSPQRARGRP